MYDNNLWAQISIFVKYIINLGKGGGLLSQKACQDRQIPSVQTMEIKNDLTTEKKSKMKYI